MNAPRFHRVVPLLALFLLLAFGLIAAGLPGVGANRASADDPPYDPFGTLDMYVMERSPADNATGVAPNAVIRATFRYEVASGSVNTSTFYVRAGSSTTNVAGAITCSGNTVTFTPEKRLSPSTTYHVTLMRGIWGVEPLWHDHHPHLQQDETWSFTIDTPPRIVNRVPAVGATNVPLGQNITITFDKKMGMPAPLSLKRVGGSKVDVVVTRKPRPAPTDHGPSQEPPRRNPL